MSSERWMLTYSTVETRASCLPITAMERLRRSEMGEEVEQKVNQEQGMADYKRMSKIQKKKKT